MYYPCRLGCFNYNEHLASRHWKAVKDYIWKSGRHVCEICGKGWNLNFHHLSYERLGTPDEWKDVVIVCRTHHSLCHWKLMFVKVPLEKKYLTRRFKYLQKHHRIGEIRPSDVLEFIFRTYSTEPRRFRAGIKRRNF